MNQADLEKLLADLPLGEIRYFDSIGSTNDEAAAWAAAGAPDLSLVFADEQTAGRGRLNRRWYTPPGAGLALSLVLRRPKEPDDGAIPFHTVLGALAVCDALESVCGLRAEIKWPNDVLVRGRKLSGVLSEAHWQGDRPIAIILGIGVNVKPASIPPEGLAFPGTCLQIEAGEPVDRWIVLRAILEGVLHRRPALGSQAFFEDWEARLAYRGEWVIVSQGEREESTGQILGLSRKGTLRLRNRVGEIVEVLAGDVRLRPLNKRHTDF